MLTGRSQWPRGLRGASWLIGYWLGSWVRIPLKARMFVLVFLCRQRHCNRKTPVPRSLPSVEKRGSGTSRSSGLRSPRTLEPNREEKLLVVQIRIEILIKLSYRFHIKQFSWHTLLKHVHTFLIPWKCRTKNDTCLHSCWRETTTIPGQI
jgi:hypothetical protein